MATQAEQLRERTQQFSLRVIRLFKALPKTEESRVIGRQLLRAATSVGANYRATGRARSRKEFASKMNIVLEEIDESVFWIELLEKAGIVSQKRLTSILDEANQLLLIFSASVRTARRRQSNHPITRSPDHPIPTNTIYQ
jgi:four helix bundle protein